MDTIHPRKKKIDAIAYNAMLQAGRAAVHPGFQPQFDLLGGDGGFVFQIPDSDFPAIVP